MNKPRNSGHGARYWCVLSALALGLLVLSGCATSGPAGQNPPSSKFDPYENINRKIYGFNDTVDSYVAEPISNVYKYITPQFVQTGVFNFFTNLKNINVVFNDVLQAKFVQGAEDTGRFAINSTVGLLGLFDVAKKIGLEQNDEDFDQTLSVWGVPKGAYLVIPFLGPSTARGVPGAVFDTAANPSTYVGAPVQVLSLLNTRASAEGALKFIDEAALDPYVFTRESFLQWRDNLASDGKSQTTAEFDEELDEQSLGVSKQNSAKNSGLLTMDKFGFGQVSRSFGSVAESFDDTAKKFQEAGRKLDRLKKVEPKKLCREVKK
jgi:phospholipid-binding lipoprotein MlaA